MYLFRLLTVFMVFLVSPIFAQITTVMDSTDGLGSAGVYSDNLGNLYISSANSNVFRIQASTTCSVSLGDCVITEIIDVNGDGTINHNRTAGVAIDSAGNVYVVGQFSDNVWRITNPTTCSTSGTACTINEIMNSSGDVAGNGVDNPFGITVDGDDNVYVASAGTHSVFRIAASSTCSTGGTPCSITEIISDTGDGVNVMTSPVGVTVDSSNNVFVTNQNSNNAFKIQTPGTCSVDGTPCTITEIINNLGSGGGDTFRFGRGIVTDNSGNVFIGSLGFGENSRVFRINTPGTCNTSGTVGTACSIAELFEGDITAPTSQNVSGMAIDIAGNVFFAGGNGDNAFRIDTPTTCSTGGTPCTITELISATGDGTNSLDGPGTVSVVNNSDVYVAGGQSFNVFRISGEAMPVELMSFSVD